MMKPIERKWKKTEVKVEMNSQFCLISAFSCLVLMASEIHSNIDEQLNGKQIP